jgi:hypothetical protein
MRTWRSWFPILSLAGGLSAAGCTDHGTYSVSWTFVGGEPAGSGCGLHGVDTIRVTGASTAGDGEDVVTLCAPGAFTAEVPVGDWTFTIHQQDVRGRAIMPTDAQGEAIPDPTATATVVKDKALDMPLTVELAPRPECSDGVDNDGDGRVDLDDDGCAGDPNTAAECVPGSDC